MSLMLIKVTDGPISMQIEIDVEEFFGRIPDEFLERIEAELNSFFENFLSIQVMVLVGSLYMDPIQFTCLSLIHLKFREAALELRDYAVRILEGEDVEIILADFESKYGHLYKNDDPDSNPLTNFIDSLDLDDFDE